MKIKNIKLASALILSLGLMFVSCGKEKGDSQDSPVTVKVVQTQVKGLLSGAFEAVAGDYEVTKDADGNMVVTIKVKRTNETVPYVNDAVDVFSKNTDGVRTFAGFGFEGYNAEGQMIYELKAKKNDFDKDKQLALLKLDNGQTGELTLKLADESLPATIVLTSGVELISTGELPLEGTIGGYKVVNFSIDVDFMSGELTGKYMYASMASTGRYLNLMGYIKNEDLRPGSFDYSVDIQEESDGNWSGGFDGSIWLTRNGVEEPYFFVIDGDFFNYRGQNFRYDFKSAPLVNK